MKTRFWYREAAIRLDYTRHCLRAAVEGFMPMTLEKFANGYARCFYLVGDVRPVV